MPSICLTSVIWKLFFKGFVNLSWTKYIPTASAQLPHLCYLIHFHDRTAVEMYYTFFHSGFLERLIKNFKPIALLNSFLLGENAFA
ncbi:hypothetical protein O6H91_11G056600 [Diphasiastrum complanatum]|uniref:Uncharacterized protein n=1 Tax=Diphasiastrum complanatum TaxID=34168 RepID=A0ACC2C9B9_DIPCM|nr:hypothetical protein O6H91_11G056600 [Diphasiastrum complanatum]